MSSVTGSSSSLPIKSPAVCTTGLSREQWDFLSLEECQRLEKVLAGNPIYTASIKLSSSGSEYQLRFEIPFVSFFINFLRRCSAQGFPISAPYLTGSLANQHVLEGSPLTIFDYDFVFEIFKSDFLYWEKIEHVFLASLAWTAGIVCDNKQEEVRHYLKDKDPLFSLENTPALKAFKPLIFDDGKAYCGQFLKNGGLKIRLPIRLDEKNTQENHLLLSIPTETENIDIYFVAKSQHQAFSSADCRRINLGPFLEANSLPSSHASQPISREARSQVIVKTVDGYTIQEAKESVKLKKYKIIHPETLHGAFKIYIYRAIKGYQPWSEDLLIVLEKAFISEYFDHFLTGKEAEWHFKMQRGTTLFETTIRSYISFKPYFKTDSEKVVTYILKFDEMLVSLEGDQRTYLSRMSISLRSELHRILGALVIESLTQNKSQDSPELILYFLQICKVQRSFISSSSPLSELFQGLVEIDRKAALFEKNRSRLLELCKHLNTCFPLPVDMSDPIGWYRSKLASSLEPLTSQTLQTVMPGDSFRHFSKWLDLYPFLLRLFESDKLKIGESLLCLFDTCVEPLTEINKQKISAIALESLKGMIEKNHLAIIKLLEAIYPHLTSEQRQHLRAFVNAQFPLLMENEEGWRRENVWKLSYYLYKRNAFPLEEGGLSLLKAVLRVFHTDESKLLSLRDLVRVSCESNPDFLSEQSHFIEELLLRNFRSTVSILEPLGNFLKKDAFVMIIEAFIREFSLTRAALFSQGCELYKKAVIKGNIPFSIMQKLYNALFNSSHSQTVKNLQELYSLLHFAAHSKGAFFEGHQEDFLRLLKKISFLSESPQFNKVEGMKVLLPEILEKIKLLASKYQGDKFKECEHLRIKALFLAYIQILALNKENTLFCQSVLDAVFADCEKMSFFKNHPLFWLVPALQHFFKKSKATPSVMLREYSEKEPLIEQLPLSDFFLIFKVFLEYLGSYKGDKVEAIIKKGLFRIQESPLSSPLNARDSLIQINTALTPHKGYLALNKDLKEALMGFRAVLQDYHIPVEEEAITVLDTSSSSSLGSSVSMESVETSQTDVIAPLTKRPLSTEGRDHMLTQVFEEPRLESDTLYSRLTSQDPNIKNRAIFEFIKSTLPFTSVDQVECVIEYISQLNLKQESAKNSKNAKRSFTFLLNYFAQVSQRMLLYLTSCKDSLRIASALGKVSQLLILAEDKARLNKVLTVNEDDSTKKKIVSKTLFLYSYRADLYRFHFKFLKCVYSRICSSTCIFNLEGLFERIKRAHSELFVTDDPAGIPLDQRAFSPREILDISNSFISLISLHPLSFDPFLKQTKLLFKDPILILERNLAILEQIPKSIKYADNKSFLFAAGLDLFMESITKHETLSMAHKPPVASYFEAAYQLFKIGKDLLKESKTFQVANEFIELAHFLSGTRATKSGFEWHKSLSPEKIQELTQSLDELAGDLKELINANQEQMASVVVAIIGGKAKLDLLTKFPSQVPKEESKE